jgi:hypothetical protein
LNDKIDPWFREWIIKQKLSHSISARFLVRFHVSLILAGAVAAGCLANWLLYRAGVTNMLLRHPAAVICAYIGFLAGLHLWIRYSGIREYVNSRRSKELLEPEGVTLRHGRPGDWVPIDAPVVADEGCLLLVGFVLVAVLAFAMGGYLILYAAELMAELVFELLLVAGLIRGIRRVDLLASIGVPRISLWALGTALTLSILFGLFAREAHPKATTIGEVVREMMASKPTR